MHTPINKLVELFGLAEEPAFAPRYNIAPTQPVAIVRVGGSVPHREWVLVSWGLIPSWAKDVSIGAKMINARAETVHARNHHFGRRFGEEDA